MVPNLLMYASRQFIWVMNSSQNHVTLPVGHLIGVLQPVDVFSGNNSCMDVRRLESSTVDTARELPEHLVNLFQSGSDGLKPDDP